MGWENVFHCEWNEFAQKVLKYYWPNAISYGDIDETDFTVWRGKIGVLSGGFPCQPYSLSGQRKGKDDKRHKWPQFFRAIKEIQPAWVVGENVRGIVKRSLLLFFETACVDYGGKLNVLYMNDGDRKIAEKWSKEGFVTFARIGFKFINPEDKKTHAVYLSNDAFELAHEERKNRFKRLYDKKKWFTVNELNNANS